ncbi:restriction endonuclease subunit S [Cytophaga hutchinsonii]|uniref:Probable type I restriction-modification system n=1 Tax=Cytophaga hutchinsonii (strain ATCC 33406 / DSM 1761 / CIP 103989 / NBRC 15051 / NCIMB 9469 / D465) TaxID=269798 RepID=A0A6N4SUU7_CYTH3|nr:restriction endonuclease subunit S [Cytophaga hutchinsonii]ABG60181.1 probable type I restriction-modification system [Cytophaga hutchinsonii ATCC 33406]SFX22519.1 type I restriction enzyme, S subunit [Cytophaga hutchinsonii ATCC 33406]
MKTKLQKYPAYKDSGVEWLGEIPKHWECIRMKHLFRDYSEKNKQNEELLSVTQNQGVVPRSWVESRMVMPSGALESFKFIQKGDFAISLRSFEGGLEYCHHDGIISPAYTVLKTKRKIANQYYKYLFKSSAFISELQTSIVGIREGKNISYPELSYSLLPIPKIDEQSCIATFLDDKTAKIDQAISIKQKQIELLKERRQILIHKAVTRGLNPKVKMKDSGVEWIGEVPEGWEVKKLLGLCNFIRGNSSFGKDDLLNDGEYVALQYGKTYKVNEVNEEYNYFVNNEFYKASQIVNYGDTIIIATSETIEELGHTAYYKRNDLGLIGGEQILLNPNNDKINSHYLYFTSRVFSKELRKYATGIKVFRFNINDLKTIYIAIPPLSEQQQIVEYIETTTAKIATAISLKENEIEKLKEYKANLVNSAVTGKIKVS